MNGLMGLSAFVQGINPNDPFGNALRQQQMGAQGSIPQRHLQNYAMQGSLEERALRDECARKERADRECRAEAERAEQNRKLLLLED